MFADEPLQIVVALVVTETSSIAGWSIVTLWFTLQPFASVIAMLYVPAAKPVTVDSCDEIVPQLYVYGAVPPVTVTVAEPVLSP